MPKNGKRVLVRNLVIPSEWNKDGQLVVVTIKTFDEDEYFINDRKETQKMLKSLRQAVEIKGIVKIKNLNKFLTKCDLKTYEIEEK